MQVWSGQQIRRQLLLLKRSFVTVPTPCRATQGSPRISLETQEWKETLARASIVVLMEKTR